MACREGWYDCWRKHWGVIGLDMWTPSMAESVVFREWWEVFVSERESGVHTGEIGLMGDDVGDSRSTPQLG